MYFASWAWSSWCRPSSKLATTSRALSWENAGKFTADLILLDNRSTALQPKDLAAKPTWAQLPAVKAGQ